MVGDQWKDNCNLDQLNKRPSQLFSIINEGNKPEEKWIAKDADQEKVSNILLLYHHYQQNIKQVISFYWHSTIEFLLLW